MNNRLITLVLVWTGLLVLVAVILGLRKGNLGSFVVGLGPFILLSAFLSWRLRRFSELARFAIGLASIVVYILLLVAIKRAIG